MIDRRPLMLCLVAVLSLGVPALLSGCSDSPDGGSGGGSGGAGGGGGGGDGGGGGGGTDGTSGADAGGAGAGDTGTGGGGDSGGGGGGSDTSTGGADDAGPGPGADAGEPAECEDCAPPAVCIDGQCVAPVSGGCEPGETTTCYGPDALMTCDDTGTAYVPVDCPASHQCQDGQCLPALCEPGKSYCQGLSAKKACNEDGTAFLDPVDCPDGMYCTSGQCGSSCNVDPKFGSYVGCAFWTADLPNWPDPTIFPTNPQDLPYAVVISNPGELDAEITWEPPDGYPVSFQDNIVPGGESRVFEMPVVNIDGSGLTQQATRFESTRPVLVHQFNPWEPIFSNDASLLLPETFLGSDYTVLSWPTDPRELIPFPGLEMVNVNSFFTVIAPQDNTEVVIRVTARVADGPGVKEMGAGALQVFQMNKGDVLNIEAEPLGLFDPMDLTGSTVSANHPVVVFAGQESAGIGGECCLDHLEEQMLPMSVLGDSYLAVKTKPRGSEPDVWRIQASEDNVTLTTTPAIDGANGVTLAKRGDWVEIETPLHFRIDATGKIQVGQYLYSQQATEDFTGDPSLILAVPTERYRDFYALAVPSGYATNWVTIIKPPGSVVSRASGPIPQSEFSSEFNGDWDVGYIELEAGVHKLAGDAKFGLVAYGFNGAVSYGYTGGMSAPGE